jgi:hypothetical protein
VANLSKYRVLLVGILSPLLALVLNIIFIQTLLALSPNPESNWRFRLLVSSLALPVPFLMTLMLALKDRRQGALSAKIGLGIAALSPATYREARDGRPCPLETVTQHGNARYTSPDV